MRKRNKQFIAYFLLLCLSTTLLPSSTFFHNHEEESHLCEIGEELEKNTCHVTIYHNEYQENHCEHNHHFSKSVEECEFCEYISSRRQLFTFSDDQLVLITSFIEPSESLILSFKSSNCNERIQGRAPPII